MSFAKRKVSLGRIFVACGSGTIDFLQDIFPAGPRPKPQDSAENNHRGKRNSLIYRVFPSAISLNGSYKDPKYSWTEKLEPTFLRGSEENFCAPPHSRPHHMPTTHVSLKCAMRRKKSPQKCLLRIFCLQFLGPHAGKASLLITLLAIYLVTPESGVC